MAGMEGEDMGYKARGAVPCWRGGRTVPPYTWFGIKTSEVEYFRSVGFEIKGAEKKSSTPSKPASTPDGDAGAGTEKPADSTGDTPTVENTPDKDASTRRSRSK